MYKVHLCLRYLRRRAIAYFAVVAVALCVAMMLIVISVMNGFLDKIEEAARGLFGDIVIETSTLSGLAMYDELVAELKAEVPEMAAASPYVQAYGILRVPNTEHRQTVSIVGIRLPERAEVSNFEDGLFVQAHWPAPTWDPPVQAMLARLAEESNKTQQILTRESSGAEAGPKAVIQEDLLRQLRTALTFQGRAAEHLEQAAAEGRLARLARLQAQLDAMCAAPGGPDSLQAAELRERIEELQEQWELQGPARRAILGLGLMALSFRTEKGETVRVINPGHQIVLTLVPLGHKAVGVASINPATETFTVVDDSRTDVWSIDSTVVYVPFETLQRMNDMDARYSADDPNVAVMPARCSQIHIKVKPAFAAGRALDAVRDHIEAVWLGFYLRHPEAAKADVSVMTWRQRHSKLIAPVENQRTLVVIMFSIISAVAVVLIFVILYTIVYQKTKDIGVLKAIGASHAGVGGHLSGLRRGHRVDRLGPRHHRRILLRALHQPGPRCAAEMVRLQPLVEGVATVRADSQRGEGLDGDSNRHCGDLCQRVGGADPSDSGGPHAAGGGPAV